MKTEELTALGLTEEQVKGVFALNGKDIEAAKQNTAELTKNYETLAKFGDATPESMNAEIEKYKNLAAEKEKAFKAQLTARDQSDWIDKKMEEYGVQSPYAREALKRECMSDDGLKWKDGSFYGFDDFMKAAKVKDPALYLTQEEKAKAQKQADLEGKAPEFVAPLDGDNSNSGSQRKELPKVW